MKKQNINILIAESSQIIYEGLNRIINKLDQNINIYQAKNLQEIIQMNITTKPNILIVNPEIIQNQLKIFNQIKKEISQIPIIAIIYNIFPEAIFSQFNQYIYINETESKIVSTIKKLLEQQIFPPTMQQEILSDREIDVLKLLVQGLSNKEIADKLNISTNTAITHRKNISQKTGIKSSAGLTIYAVINKIISI